MDVFPLVVEFVLVQDLVQECQAAGLTAHGALSKAGEPHCVVVGCGVKARHNAKVLGNPV